MQSIKLKAIMEEQNPNVDIWDLVLQTGDSLQNKEAGCVANNYTGNIDLHNVNLYDIWKDATQAKPAVNDRGKNALQIIVNDILPNSVDGKKIFTQDFGSHYRDIKNKMKEILKTNTKEENCIFERYNVTLRPIEECLFYFNESGIGATNAASLSSNYFTMLTAAMMSDAGPGSGDIPFPAVNHNLSIPSDIMNIFGFNNNWRWSAKITVDGGKYSANYNVTYDQENYNMNYQSVLNYSTNKIKNEKLSDQNIEKNEKEKYVVFKELGDSMQNASYIAFVYYMCTNIEHLRYINLSLIAFCRIKENNKKCSVNDNKITIKDELDSFNEFNEYVKKDDIDSNIKDDFKSFIYKSCNMITCDFTVHYRNIIFNVPSIMYGIGINDDDDDNDDNNDDNNDDDIIDTNDLKLKIGRRFIPVSDTKIILKMKIKSKIRIIKSNLNTIKFFLNYIIIRNLDNVYYLNTDTKIEEVSLMGTKIKGRSGNTNSARLEIDHFKINIKNYMKQITDIIDKISNKYLSIDSDKDDSIQKYLNNLVESNNNDNIEDIINSLETIVPYAYITARMVKASKIKHKADGYIITYNKKIEEEKNDDTIIYGEKLIYNINGGANVIYNFNNAFNEFMKYLINTDQSDFFVEKPSSVEEDNKSVKRSSRNVPYIFNDEKFKEDVFSRFIDI